MSVIACVGSDEPAGIVSNDCSDCGPEWEAVTTIDGRRSAELGGPPRTIGRDGNGRVYITTRLREVPAVFSHAGDFVGRLGRLGDGPDEVARVSWLDAGRDDSVRVFSLPKVLVFNSNLAFARSYNQREVAGVGSPAQLAYLSDGKIVLQLNSPESPSNPFPTRVISQDGAVEAVLDLRDSARQMDVPRVGSAHDNGNFWGIRPLAADRRGYELGLYDQRGRLVKALERSPAWYLAYSASGAADRFFSRPLAIRETSRGVVVCLIAQPQASPDANPAAGAPLVSYNTIVDIVDVQTARLFGSRTLAGQPVAILSSGYVVTYATVDEAPVVTVWQVPEGLRTRPQ